MDVKPFLHKHYLLFDKYQNQKAFCHECNQNIDGWAFTCELCKFWLHQSCAEQKLPPLISHPLHSKLFLQNTKYKDFICDKCFTLARGFKYSNEDHSFNLDLMCASSIDDQTVKEGSERSKDLGKKIQHFCHDHSLTLFNYRKVRWYEYCCGWCEKPLTGMSYGCVQCWSPIFIHELCLHTIPHKILEHPFHSHPLHITSSGYILICDICLNDIISRFRYFCSKCNFRVHVLCTKLKPTLRHECHNHDLTYIATTENGSKCQKCKGDVKESSIYRCVQCNCSFHFECLVPSTITHKYHIHPLTVITSFKDDGLGEYYCDICEEQRNPEHPVYYCNECTYIAHIECGLGNKVVDAKLYWRSTSSLDLSIDLKTLDSIISKEYLMVSTKNKGLEIVHFDHPHPLIFKEVIENNEKPLCVACEVEVCHQAYVCEMCGYYLHKKSAEVSYEVPHPLHSFDHPLFFDKRFDARPKGNRLFEYIDFLQKIEDFICDNCREVSSGFRYYCYRCNFKLDIKCILGTASDIERPTNLFHFIHNHELLLSNCRPTSKRSFLCGACCLKISGPAYCCLRCNLFVHESCLEKLPREIQIQSHPQHNLLPNTNVQISDKVCLACKSADPSFWYNCLQCDIYIHFYCAGALLQRPLSSKYHFHNLYLFPRDKPRLLQKHQSSNCEKCNKTLGKQSIYHCIQCDINFHLQCVEIFYRVKCKHHIHPLTLKGCFAEDDSREYYCDVCEEKRDPENDVYYCEDCDGQFTTHIECAAAEVEEVLLQYGPFPYSLPET